MDKLVVKINILLSTFNWTELTKSRLKDLLIRYELSRLNKDMRLLISECNINEDRFKEHLIGFIDGDGCLRLGKRVGHKKGLYRFVPNILIDLHINDIVYLELIKDLFNIKKVYIRGSTKLSAALVISSELEVSNFIRIVDNSKGFISQRRVRDFKLLKKIVAYNKETKLIVHNETWLNKGLDLVKDYNTYNNLDNSDEFFEKIKKNLTIEYIMGFIEAEGSFVLHYNNTKKNIWNSFEISQASANDLILKGILNFIDNYDDPLYINNNVKIITKGILIDNAKSRKQPLSRLLLSNTDVLFNKIVPMLLSTDMYTKKQINLVYWIFGLIIIKDFKNIDECVELFFEIKTKINNNDDLTLLELDKILTILLKYIK